jgi:hypothetical protein
MFSVSKKMCTVAVATVTLTSKYVIAYLGLDVD